MEGCLADDSFEAVVERMRGRRAVVGLGRIAATTASFMFPPRDRLYRTVRKKIHETGLTAVDVEPQIHPDITTVQLRIDDVLVDYRPEVDLSLDVAQQSMLVNALYQFSDRNGVARYTATPYERIGTLHGKIVAEGRRQPVTVDRQLAWALEQTASLPGAVWDLFLTTRQFARWRDGDSITHLPAVDTDEATGAMLTWERSLAGYKPPDAGGYQDAAGDSYYVWTHALARILYSSPVAGDGVVTRFYRTMFEHGSKVMSASHRLGRLSAVGTMSNHVIAGEYGNAVGDRLVDYIRWVSPRSKK